MSRSGAAPASATAQLLRRVRDPSPPPVPRPRERFLPPPHHGLAAARAPALLLRHARRSPPGARPRRTGTRYIAPADAVSFGVAACGSDLAQPRATASSSLLHDGALPCPQNGPPMSPKHPCLGRRTPRGWCWTCCAPPHLRRPARPREVALCPGRFQP